MKREISSGRCGVGLDAARISQLHPQPPPPTPRPPAKASRVNQTCSEIESLSGSRPGRITESARCPRCQGLTVAQPAPIPTLARSNKTRRAFMVELLNLVRLSFRQEG